MLLEKSELAAMGKKKMIFCPCTCTCKLIQGIEVLENINTVPILKEYLLFEYNILLPPLVYLFH